MVTALIMAGGKGTRMKSSLEKPLIPVEGKPMIEWVLRALEGSEKIDDIIGATTEYTPKTEEFLKSKGIKIIRTPGMDYITDLRYIISKLTSDTVLLTITADLPLIRSSTLDYVVEQYESCGKPALCVAINPEIFRSHNLKPSWQFEGIIPSGLNILRTINQDQDEEVIFVNELELALNINSQEDIIFLEEHLNDSGKKLGKS